MDLFNRILVNNMVLNTITNNMEKLIMKRKIVFHNETAIKNALLLFGQGWTAHRIANKMKVTDQTVYNWSEKYPKYAVRKVTNISKNGAVTTIKPVTTRTKRTVETRKDTNHELTITFGNKTHETIVKLAKQELRTVPDQAKYLVLMELQRLLRNSTNIPF